MVYQTTKECSLNEEHRGTDLEIDETKTFGFATLNEQGDGVIVTTADKLGYELEGFCLRSSGPGSKYGWRQFKNFNQSFNVWKQRILFAIKSNTLGPILITIPKNQPNDSWTVDFNVITTQAPVVSPQKTNITPIQETKLSSAPRTLANKEFPIKISNGYGEPIVYQTSAICETDPLKYTGITLKDRSPQIFGYLKFNDQGTDATIVDNNMKAYTLEGFCIRRAGTLIDNTAVNPFTNLKNNFDTWKSEMIYKVQNKAPKLIQINIRPSTFLSSWDVNLTVD